VVTKHVGSVHAGTGMLLLKPMGYEMRKVKIHPSDLFENAKGDTPIIAELVGGQVSWQICLLQRQRLPCPLRTRIFWRSFPTGGPLCIGCTLLEGTVAVDNYVHCFAL